MRSHIADALCQVDGEVCTLRHVVPLLLEAGQQQHMAVTQERHRQHVRPLEEPVLPVHVNESTSSGSSQLVGGVPTVPESPGGSNGTADDTKT